MAEQDELKSQERLREGGDDHRSESDHVAHEAAGGKGDLVDAQRQETIEKRSRAALSTAESMTSQMLGRPLGLEELGIKGTGEMPKTSDLMSSLSTSDKSPDSTEQQAKQRVEELAKGHPSPEKIIANVNKIEPPELREAVLTELRHSDRPEFAHIRVLGNRGQPQTIEKFDGEENKRRMEEIDREIDARTPERLKEEAEAKRQAQSPETVVPKIEELSKKYLDSVHMWPSADNERGEDRAEGDLRKAIAELKDNPNREEILKELEKKGATIGTDADGHPTIKFDESWGPDKITIRLDQSYEEMQKEANTTWDEAQTGLMRYVFTAGAAADRAAQKAEGTLPEEKKKWFERKSANT